MLPIDCTTCGELDSADRTDDDGAAVCPTCAPWPEEPLYRNDT